MHRVVSKQVVWKTRVSSGPRTEVGPRPSGRFVPAAAGDVTSFTPDPHLFHGVYIDYDYPMARVIRNGLCTELGPRQSVGKLCRNLLASLRGMLRILQT